MVKLIENGVGAQGSSGFYHVAIQPCLFQELLYFPNMCSVQLKQIKQNATRHAHLWDHDNSKNTTIPEPTTLLHPCPQPELHPT